MISSFKKQPKMIGYCLSCGKLLGDKSVVVKGNRVHATNECIEWARGN